MAEGEREEVSVEVNPRELTFELSDVQLHGTLAEPPRRRGLVLFAHASGNARLRADNRHLASLLHRFGLCTLLFDLLTAEEDAKDELAGTLKCDVPLLTRRLLAVTDWTRRVASVRALPLGYFASGTGAAAALMAAAQRPAVVDAVVSRGGRPDLADGALAHVIAPTLFIVGKKDGETLELNERAKQRMRRPPRLEIIPGASHLFQEEGALDAMGHLAAEWFAKFLEAEEPEEFRPQA